MAKIPQDIYERVLEFAMLITNAELAGDDVLSAIHYSAFSDYHAEIIRDGRCHPFLLETLADYTDDETLAMTYYEQSLALSRQMNEPTHTILIAMGQAHHAGKRFELAEACLRDGLAEARLRGDLDMVKEAKELLRELGS